MPRSSSLRLGRMQWLDLSILIGVVAVVVIVSLPRLSAFARSENRADAARLARRLAQVLDDAQADMAAVHDVSGLFQRLPRQTRRQFEDQSVLDDGRLILRHGYFFEYLRVPGFEGDRSGARAIRAWPERYGGDAAPVFLALSEQSIFTHDRLEPACYGFDKPPPIESTQPADLHARGWRLLAPIAND